MPSTVAADILRGTMRLLLDMGMSSLPELTLATGRRIDLMGLGSDGQLVAVEIKSSRADFLADGKWPDYLAFADRFYFAVAPDFPLSLLPGTEGLIVADRYAATILRPAVERPLPAARRRALVLRFARTAALRLQGVEDPGAVTEPA